MRISAASVLLALGGLVHVGALVVFSSPGRARPLTIGDAVFLLVFATLYLVAAWGLRRRRRWGRWLGMAVSGIESIPAAVLLYVLVVFSADPGSRGMSGERGFVFLLLVPLIVFVAVWRHRATRQGFRP